MWALQAPQAAQQCPQAPHHPCPSLAFIYYDCPDQNRLVCEYDWQNAHPYKYINMAQNLTSKVVESCLSTSSLLNHFPFVQLSHCSHAAQPPSLVLTIRLPSFSLDAPFYMILTLLEIAAVSFVIYLTASFGPGVVNLLSRKREQSSSNTGKSTLPGPKGLPVLGSAHELPRLGSWFAMKAWADKHGPIMQTTVMGSKWLFFNTHDSAHAHLNERSNIYSGRPDISIVADARSDAGSAEYLPLMNLNIHHTRQKKFNKITMDVARNQRHYGIPTAEARRFIQQISEQRSNTTAWPLLVEDFASRTICRLTFGDANYHKELNEHVWRFLAHISPAGFLPNMISSLVKLPYYLSYWKQAEYKRHRDQQAFFMRILQQIRADILSNKVIPSSYMKTYLTSRIKDEAAGKPSAISTDREGAAALGLVATAAVYTVGSPIQSFIRMLATFPDYQARLHSELDAVVPATRLPELSDMPDLPLLRACIKETARWRPPIPTSIPHKLDRADVVNGCLVAADTPVFAAEYSICRDAVRFPRPFDFLPERWLEPAFPTTFREPTTRYPELLGSTMFGWGRRWCMGQHVSQDELYAACAHLVWAFEVRPTARGEAQLVEHLGPGEGRGGMQWPQKSEQGLLIPRPEDLECVWEWRGPPGERERLMFADGALATTDLEDVVDRARECIADDVKKVEVGVHVSEIEVEVDAA
ncbi:hypothetical protein FH972_026590 [Carpinus fangiana]|uniref:Cytochrome P450 n=1 Tax=Carpinus fangiana TaxID=176857 RepID=A0A5N6L6Y9_9ROSI|nr:hypothetical protein FH972_026590 [Carpinus fangiana]